MTSSWLLFSSTLVVLVLLGSASTPDEEDDSLMMQREVDLSDLIGSMVEQQPVMLQRELDEPDLPNPFEQTPSILGFRPRSFGLPPSMQYPVEFPLARPTPRNLDDICLYGDRRPHYPDSYFPSSGYGQLKRQAKAVNRVESWYRSCCERNQTWASGVTLCCAQRAWTRSLKVFCKESSSVKDRLHHCCKRSGNNVFSCFNSEAVNPHYQPTEEIPAPPLTSTPNFNFDPSTCQGQETPPSSVRGPKGEEVLMSTTKKVDFNFPPGRPTADSIQSLCDNQDQRQLYNLMCLKDSEHELLALQALTVNRMEKGFKICCKKNKAALNCAKHKWSRELDRFCANKGEKLDVQCCSAEANDRYNCFENLSSDPYYNTTTKKVGVEKLCDTYKIINRKFPVGFPLASFVAECCPLAGEEIGDCYSKKLKAMSKFICTSKKSANPAVRRCCRMPANAFPGCMSTVLLNAIDKATKEQSKKRKCPIS